VAKVIRMRRAREKTIEAIEAAEKQRTLMDRKKETVQEGHTTGFKYDRGEGWWGEADGGLAEAGE
jgi:hypothetical protein